MSARAWPVGVALLGVALAVGCGASKAAPDLITRPLAAGDSSPRDGSVEVIDETDLDAGSFLVDAGVCCQVTFTVPAQADDVSAALVMNGTSRFELSRDGGAWTGAVCMALAPAVYVYEVALPTGAEDGGVYLTTRINDGVPSVMGNSAPYLNVFDPGAASTCEALDAGVYGTLPDAG